MGNIKLKIVKPTMEEKFCLKWNDFQENTIRTFSKLRSEEEFYDVTLVSDDQKQIMAHKVVLSSSSQYFKNILKSNKHSHPLLCLIGLSSIDLKNVLDYIYEGEVQIFQRDIDKFLDIAQRLKIDGLLSSDKDEEQREYFSNQPLETELKHEQIQTFEKANEIICNETPGVNTKNAVSLNDNSSFDEIEQKVSEYVGKNENNDYICNLCGKVGGKHIRNIKNHIETHLEGISFSCSLCGKHFRSRNSLNCHKTVYHKNK